MGQGGNRVEPGGRWGLFVKSWAPTQASVAETHKSHWGPGLESGARWQLGLEVSVRRTDDGCEGIWRLIKSLCFMCHKVLEASPCDPFWFQPLPRSGGDRSRHFHSLGPTCWQTFSDLTVFISQTVRLRFCAVEERTGGKRAKVPCPGMNGHVCRLPHPEVCPGLRCCRFCLLVTPKQMKAFNYLKVVFGSVTNTR